MDVRSWESFQQDMLDVVKDLKYFPPPNLVATWTAQGKLGKQGMKDNDDMFMPAEYDAYKDVLQSRLGVVKMEVCQFSCADSEDINRIPLTPQKSQDLIHITAEEIHLCDFPPAIENKLMHERHAQMAMRGHKITESKQKAGICALHP